MQSGLIELEWLCDVGDKDDSVGKDADLHTWRSEFNSQVLWTAYAHYGTCTQVHTLAHTGIFINTKKSLNDDRGAILVINIYAPNNRAPKYTK